jgi:hypothetical protein
LKKLAFYKEGGSGKHIDDIKGMLEVSCGQISTLLIEKWVRKLGLSDEWALVLK